MLPFCGNQRILQYLPKALSVTFHCFKNPASTHQDNWICPVHRRALNFSTLADHVESDIRPFEEIPGPRPIPGLGTSYKYLPGGEYHFADRVISAKLKFKKYGDLVKEELFPGVFILHVCHPDDVEKVYRADGKFPVRAVMKAYQTYSDNRKFPRSLFNSKGDRWLQLRSGVQRKMMQPQSVSEYIPVLDQVGDDLVKCIRAMKRTNQNQIYVNELMQKYTLEAVGTLVFNTRLKALELDSPNYTRTLLKHVRTFFPMEQRMVYSLYHQFFPSNQWFHFVKGMDFVFGETSHHYDNCLENKVKDSLPSEICPNLVRGLIDSTGGDKFLVTDVMNVLLLGGVDNTSNVLHYVLYNLAHNPEVQQRLYDEVTQVFPQGDSVTKERLHHMTYLKAVVKESFRFTPAAPTVSRVNTKELVLKGYRIPPYTKFLFNFASTSHDSRFVRDPDKFYPERWLRDSGDHVLHPFLMMPFGHGARMCLGKRFAEQEIYIAIAKLIQNFRLSYSGPEIQFVTMLGNYPIRDQVIEFTERNRDP